LHPGLGFVGGAGHTIAMDGGRATFSVALSGQKMPLE
jgi:hypothetical protein